MDSSSSDKTDNINPSSDSANSKISNPCIFVDANTWNIPEDSIFGILAGETPLPIPKNNEDAFNAIQGQMDKYIVDHLPSEFWGSQFYLPSKSKVHCPKLEHSHNVRKDIKLIRSLTALANCTDTNILRLYNRRLSPKRSKSYLNSLREKFKHIVSEE